MHVAEAAVHEFLGRIQKISYSSRSNRPPEDLAELLDYWLASGGMEVLGESYENFLQMVVILLTDPALAKGIEFLALTGSKSRTAQVMARPKTADWVKKVGKDVFERALNAYRYELDKE